MKRIFVIHGWTYNLDKWKKIDETLKQRGIELIFLKVPGLTESSTAVWTIAAYEDWLDKQMTGTDKPIIIGHSNGGRIALSYIQHNPGRVGTLILIDSAGLVHDQWWLRIKLAILRIISKVGKLIIRLPVFKKIVYTLIGARDYFDAPQNMKLTMRNMLESDKQINLSKITVPTTIIWGRADTITPLKDGQKIHDLIVGSKLHVIDDARHAPFANHPDEVADIITATVESSS